MVLTRAEVPFLLVLLLALASFAFTLAMTKAGAKDNQYMVGWM
jgi:hypothetical protein